MWKEPDVLAVSGVVATMMAMIIAVISMAAGDLPRLRDSSLAVLMGLVVIIISKTGKDVEGKMLKDVLAVLGGIALLGGVTVALLSLCLGDMGSLRGALANVFLGAVAMMAVWFSDRAGGAK